MAPMFVCQEGQLCIMELLQWVREVQRGGCITQAIVEGVVGSPHQKVNTSTASDGFLIY